MISRLILSILFVGTGFFFYPVSKLAFLLCLVSALFASPLPKLFGRKLKKLFSIFIPIILLCVAFVFFTAGGRKMSLPATSAEETRTIFNSTDIPDSETNVRITDKATEVADKVSDAVEKGKEIASDASQEASELTGVAKEKGAELKEQGKEIADELNEGAEDNGTGKKKLADYMTVQNYWNLSYRVSRVVNKAVDKAADVIGLDYSTDGAGEGN